jgi:tyrosinase
MNAPVWDAETGFGGNGAIDEFQTVGNGSCVRDGPFAGYEIYYANLETNPHCLSRGFNFQGKDFAPEEVEMLYSNDKLANFSMELEERSHDAIPNVSVSMTDNAKATAELDNRVSEVTSLFLLPLVVSRSSYAFVHNLYRLDPVWFLHHSNIDRLFWRWQMGDPDTRMMYDGLSQESQEVRKGLDAPMKMLGLADELLAKDVLDPKSGRLCYTFV